MDSKQVQIGPTSTSTQIAESLCEIALSGDIARLAPDTILNGAYGLLVRPSGLFEARYRTSRRQVSSDGVALALSVIKAWNADVAGAVRGEPVEFEHPVDERERLSGVQEFDAVEKSCRK
jgi:hypothetical protein